MVDDALRIKVFVQPGSKFSKVGGSHNGDLKIRVSEKAVDGIATKATLRLLADSFGVKQANIRLIWGARSKSKLIEIIGDRYKLEEHLKQLLNPSDRLFEP